MYTTVQKCGIGRICLFLKSLMLTKAAFIIIYLTVFYFNVF